ncbi:MAG TPA: glycosyltransferase family 4 protein [Solirubrobacteraceae bacterium]|jgi:glycosyltransferase involved in cell wall biosynthesis|nr:glycosyltransferase family 4 protein [Solirubrobacteraceae bacterium]
MRVVYVNHTAAISGAEHSLLSLLGAPPPGVRPSLAAPEGPLAAATRGLSVPTAKIVGTAGSLRLHPLHTPRALAELSAAGLQVRRIARDERASLVHANSIRAGIVLALARPAPAATVVHVRDCLPPGAVSRATMRLIAASASTIVANSRHTATSVLALAPGARVEVVHNPVDLARFDPARIDRAQARARLGAAGERALLLGVVAQLSPWKGQDTAIEALRMLCAQGVDAHLLLIGAAKFTARATRFDNRAHLAQLRAQVADAGLGERVSFLGERGDVPELVRALDALLLPSWEEPFGRALIEAMALGVPVLATSVGGPPEIVCDGREGFLVRPRDPAAWARAISRMVELGPERRRELGAAGRRRVEREFSLEHHTAAVGAVYERALAAVATLSRRVGARREKPVKIL